MTDYCSKTVDANGKPFVSFGFHTASHTGCHPVLVLDPEDAKQMKALSKAYWATELASAACRMAAAVRSMLTPPKIAEPDEDEDEAFVDAALAEMGQQARADEACSICHASVSADRRARHLNWHASQSREGKKEHLQQVFGGAEPPKIAEPEVALTYDEQDIKFSRKAAWDQCAYAADGEDERARLLAANPYRGSTFSIGSRPMWQTDLLRTLRESPKIAEPTNRYAVVVDKDGVEWVRLDDRWRSGKSRCIDLWHAIDAVRVLADGVADDE